MREGAHDYLTKPFAMSTFLARLEQVIGTTGRDGDPVLGVSHAMRDLEHFIRRAARVNSTVLLTGETGVGKEVCARFLHSACGKANGPFMAVNCAAFTGAHARHQGYAERAGDGVPFLDEISELTPKLQAKLLRVIESRSFHRVGGEQAIPFKARLICATDADLRRQTREGTFREDLYFRINVIACHVPPLRDRPDDIEWLLDRFFAEFTREESPMRGCDKLVDVDRRQFLRGGALATAGAAAAAVLPQEAAAKPNPARVEYRSSRLANVSQLKPNRPLEISYPDRDSPGVLIKLGTRVAGGAGPDGDIVAFSTLCPHKGFP